MRLQVVLSRAGVASRRKAVSIIEAGRVLVNGRIVRQKGAPVDPNTDTVIVDGRRVVLPQKKLYVLVNKPRNIITSRRDPQGRRTVFDILPPRLRTLHPVGRLDRHTTGLLLLTNDGELTYRLTHPKFEVRKRYRVCCKGRIGDKEKNRLEKGIVLGGRRTARATVHIIRSEKDSTELYIEIHEGRKRQIRDMFLFLGHPIKRLERVAYEFLKLGSLKRGHYRFLTKTEVRRLKEL